MGHGIALEFALAGYSVSLSDVSDHVGSGSAGVVDALGIPLSGIFDDVDDENAGAVRRQSPGGAASDAERPAGDDTRATCKWLVM